MSFKDLETSELYRVAVEDFAVDIRPEDKDNRKIIEAALTEDGVTWEMYMKAHPELAPVKDEKPKRGGPVTSPDVTGKEEKPMTVRTATPAVDTSTEDMYLVKMDRDNPYFEWKRCRFTSTHPFVPMNALDASRIVREEDGFSIATPLEAQEYYENA